MRARMGWTPRLVPVVIISSVVAFIPASARADSDPGGGGSEAAAPDAPAPPFSERIEVKERADDLLGIAMSATEGTTGHSDLAKRPVLRAGELLETVPGVIVTQHSGDGKANQYFLRGFNLDHGTDFRVTVADIPLNMPSHGHGQGYADLNFLIPELVDTVQFRKGPYFADEGDFSAAGAARIDYVRSLARPLLEVTGGSFDYARTLYATSFSARGGDLLLAAEGTSYDGPWNRPDDFRRLNGLLRFTRGDLFRGTSLTFQAYDATWDATDQIPLRAVEQGVIGRLGTIDPSDGGRSHRYALSAETHRGDAEALTRLSGYVLDYDLRLFSNFTYFLDDPVSGDQFEQLDRRQVSGFDLGRTWRSPWGDRKVESSLGLQVRADRIHNGLFRTRDRQPLRTTREDRIFQVSGGPYAQALIHWTDRIRTQFGLRADGYHAEVESDDDANSGSRNAAILSPKLSLAIGPLGDWEYYANVGYGFHSNDVRGAVIRVDPGTGLRADRVTPLVRAVGADVGLRTRIRSRLQTTVSLFGLDLDSELLFVGDGGTTEASRPSRRVGIEWANFFQPIRWLSFDLDVAATRARFTDPDPAGDRIPGAIDRVLSAGVAVETPRRFFGSLRWRYLGPRPLIQDNGVRSASTSLVNARIGYEFGQGLRIALDLFNVFNRAASDIDYFYASRLPGEPPEGVDDIHLHPVESRSLRLFADWKF